jgi:dihydroorotase-like cyclic amidohydrolase
MRPKQTAPLLIRNALVIDGKGGKRRASLRIAAGRIVEIGNGGGDIAASARILDAEGKWSFPG